MRQSTPSDSSLLHNSGDEGEPAAVAGGNARNATGFTDASNNDDRAAAGQDDAAQEHIGRHRG